MEKQHHNKSPCRVLFLSDHLGYADGVIHGATTYFLNTLPLLQQTGMALTVCFLRQRHGAAGELEAAGITPLFLNRGKWDLRAAHDLTRLIRTHDINLVHAAGMKGILLGRWAARRTGARFLAHLHDTNPLDPVTRLLQRSTAGWTDGCIGISQAVCAYATETMGMAPGKVHLLYSGLPLERYARSADQSRDAMCTALKVPASSKRVAVIGRLSPEKGHEAFLRGGAGWLATRPEVHVLIIGGGPLDAHLRAVTQTLGITEQVHFLGHRDDVPELLPIADAVVMPSHREGLGYTALEAMAAGRPVVAYAVGGLAEIIQDGDTGLLAPPDDAATLWKQVAAVLDDQALASRLGTRGREHARAFSVEQHVQALIRLYGQLTAETVQGGRA